MNMENVKPLCKRPYIKGSSILGDGRVRVCVPIMGQDEDTLLKDAEKALISGCDLVEWRVDHFRKYKDPGVVSTTLSLLHRKLRGMPVIFTFRTKNEGGEGVLPPEDYVTLYKYAMDTGNGDLFDVEYKLGESIAEELIQYAGRCDAAVILSCHDFNKTPGRKEMCERLLNMEALKPQAVKLAVMPENAGDVLELMCASLEYSSREEALPLISMAMGGLGNVSRVAGHITGSCMTFASQGKASAPGQLSVSEARNIMSIIGPEKQNGNIVLIGFMGVGKTSVSKYLKKRYGMRILDMDSLISEREGKSITDIFSQNGEEYFRSLETELLKELAGYSNTVISTGGGVPMRPENVALMKKAGRVFLLRATPETILDRVKRSHSRPLLENNKNTEFIGGLMEQRREKYESAAEYIIDTDGKQLYKICEEIMGHMK